MFGAEFHRTMVKATATSFRIQLTYWQSARVFHRYTNAGKIYKPEVPSRSVKRRLHKVIVEVLAELREEGTESIVNLTFYEIVKARMKSFASSNHSIAVYLIRHRNEFKIQFGERQSTHIGGVAAHWRDILLNARN